MRIAFFTALLVTAPALAAPPELQLPLDCRLGESCWLMNYADTDTGPGVKDFRCRGRSYDGHDGTDFAVRDAGQAMPVVAPAAGTVMGVRDGEPDGAYLAKGMAAVAGKECGNGVLLRHQDGWETQLCHLRAGSLRVTKGQQVAAGQVVGLVGLSGQSEFPHVHLTLRHGGKPRDPFTGGELNSGCGEAGEPAWARPVAYQAGAVYAAGFHDRLPKAEALKADAASPAAMAADAPALVLWGTLFGTEAGDVIRLVLHDPAGTVVLSRDTPPAPKAQAWRMEAAGIDPRQGNLAKGVWAGEVTLLRAGQPIDRRATRVEVR